MSRKQKKYHFIYKTVNILSGKYYYGMHSTSNLDDGYVGSGKRLRYSIRKYGKINHVREIIEFCKNRNELKKREEEIVNLNEIAKNDCMNIVIGGEGGGIITDNHRQKSITIRKFLRENDIKWKENNSTSISSGLKKAYKTGKRKSKFDYNWVGKKHTDETKIKIGLTNSIKQKGKNNSQYGTIWICNINETKKIKNEELNNYLLLGWKKGRSYER